MKRQTYKLVALLFLLKCDTLWCQYSYNDYVKKFNLNFYEGDSKEERLRFLDSILLFDPSMSSYFFCCSEKNRLGEFKSSTDDYSRLLTICHTKVDSALVLIRRGECQSLYNNINAFEDFELAVKLNPTVEGYLRRAFLQKETRNAIFDYDSAIIIMNKDSSLYYEPYKLRGLFKYKIKDYAGALKDLNIAIKIEPLCGECYKTKAMISSDTGVIDCDSYEKAVYWGYSEFEFPLQRYCKH